jgi:hypothetical protein
MPDAMPQTTRLLFFYSTFATLSLFVFWTDTCVSRQKLETVGTSIAACDRLIDKCEKDLSVCTEKVDARLGTIIDTLKGY